MRDPVLRPRGRASSGWTRASRGRLFQLFKESRSILLSSMSSLGSGSPEVIERFWPAFVLYCVSRLGKTGRGKEDGGITLCQILRAFRLNIVDFFKEMPQFCIKLKELQANVVHSSLLSRYYKRAYQELFVLNDAKPALRSQIRE
ncbi:hypothetical protein E2562_027534 [Oryza meyeriana var. granulata]|uniref:Retinoblastoma-associated protein N-terminal domain-containing protein n=1 Tax=Oryza meyeriana var. granulata TaxID=110450 RepID=A0A6G1CHP7_9ORYZ|nr:hypothetical protein E2562_027534 [Oryza meyeriana var. granulata]